jgi:predicted dithiol-disulfide oxidoreductase (DUF899 family)
VGGRTNAFIRDGDGVFRTYFINARGDEALGSTWSCRRRPYKWRIWPDEPHRLVVS